MSTNVKLVGYYVKFSSEERAISNYREMGYKVSKSSGDFSEGFIEDNYDELFYESKKDSIGKWIPEFDTKENLGALYLIEYEYDSFGVNVSFDKEPPSLFGVKGTPFVVLYYNGTDCPLELK